MVQFKRKLGVESNLGVTLNKQHKFAEAKEVLTKLLPVLKREFHPADPRVLGCMRHLMEALWGLGRLEDARRLNDMMRGWGGRSCVVNRMVNMRLRRWSVCVR